MNVGTPLTHRRFSRRPFGAYGPGVAEDGTVWNLLQAGELGVPGVLLAGDTCFPGIGVPGVAASGTIAANTAVGVREHGRQIKRGKRNGIIQ